MKEHILELGSTYIKINNYNWGDIPQLENLFKIWNKITHKYEYNYLYHDESAKVLYLPRGMDLNLVEKIMKRRVDNIYKPSPYDIYSNIKVLPPRDEVQKEALRFMIGLAPYQATIDKSQLILNLTTGKGKTYISIATIAHAGIKSIVIASSTSWLDQWRERITRLSNIYDREVYTIIGSWSIKRLLEDDYKIISRTKIFLVTHSTIRNYAEENGWESVRDLFHTLKIGYKFFDEAHLDFKNTLMIDYFTDVYKTFYITATFGRSSQDEDRIYQMCFKKILAIDLYNKQEDAHTSYVGLFFKSGATSGEITSCKGVYGLDRNRYVNYLIHKENYYKLIALLMDIILPKLQGDKKALLYIGTNDAIQITYDWLNQYYPELQNNIGIFSMISNNKQLALTKKIILTTTKSAGACVDIPGLKITVVLNEPFKSSVLAQQTIGRTRDNDTLYIECIDNDFYYCKKYYYAKKSIYAKYATDCTEIKISQEDLDNAYQLLLDKNTQYTLQQSIKLTQSQRIIPYIKLKENEKIKWYEKV